MLDKLIKWFRCKMCCQSKCSIGDVDNYEEELQVKYKGMRKGRRNSI